MNQLVPMNAAVPAFTMSDVARIAEAIARGGLFGSKDPNAVLTLCLLAQAEGQHPAVVFRDYHIIQGRPAKKADAMLRDFINAGGKVEWHTLTDECADATFTHSSGSARIEWTLARAKKAQLTTPMWSKYPRQMLRSRVISEGVRTVYPGATSGLYEENEVRDIVAENPVVEARDGGIIEGQSGGHAIGPDGPANHTLRDQLEQSIEQETDRAVRPKDGGPPKTVLDKIENRIVHELNGCGDEDMLVAYLETADYKADKAVLEEYRPSSLYGPAPDDCPEYLPIKAKIAAMVKEFRSPVREPHILDAG